MSVYATFNGETIARSNGTILVEGARYFPVEDVRMEMLRATSSRTLCPRSRRLLEGRRGARRLK